MLPVEEKTLFQVAVAVGRCNATHARFIEKNN
jgi:hypothetical protein